MSLPEPPQKRRGCLFYGCLTSAVLALVLGGAVFLLVTKGVRQFNEAMDKYTQTAPVTLPKADMPAEELKQLQKRVDDFGNGLDARTNSGPLVLTGREANALLQETPQAQELHLQEHFFLTFEGDEIKAQVSIPMSNYNAGVSFLHTKGRYFNGVATLGAAFTNSELSVKVKSVETADGKPLPAKFIGVLQDWDDKYILEDVNNNPTNFGVLSNIESVIFTNGTVVITPKK